MSKLRRFLLFLALAFSFGGFTFYAAVVVPIGGEVLGKTTQGFVTQRVSRVMNVATAVTVAFLTWEAIVNWPNRSRVANVVLLSSTVIIGICCVALAAIHPQLDSHLVIGAMSVTDQPGFYRAHQLYLWVSAFQWLVTLPVLWLLANGRQSA